MLDCLSQEFFIFQFSVENKRFFRQFVPSRSLLAQVKGQIEEIHGLTAVFSESVLLDCCSHMHRINEDHSDGELFPLLSD